MPVRSILRETQLRLSGRPRAAAAGLAIGYLLLATVAVSVTRFEGGVAFVWLASGLLLAQLCALPVEQWGAPLVLCGMAGWVAGSAVGFGPRASPFMVIANLGEAVTAALLLRRVGHHRACLETVPGVAWLLVAAGLVAPALSGLVGATVAATVSPVPFGRSYLHWFAGHALGTITAMPVFTLALRGDIPRWWRQGGGRARVRTAAIFAVVAAVTIATFSQTRLPILFLPLLPMIGATILLGRLGAAGSMVILLVVGGLWSLHGSGPVHLIRADVGERVLFFQFYMACATALVLPVAALLRQQAVLFRRLAESEAKYRLLSEGSGDPILEVSRDGVVLFASQAVHATMGVDPARLMGSDARMLAVADDLPELWRTHERALADPAHAHVAQFRLAAGPDRWFEVSMRAVETAGGSVTGVVASLRDVTRRKLAEQALAHAAATDMLTGLANRRAWFEAASAAAGGEAACVALFDLDHFKAVNDRFGHAAGDVALQGFARRATATLRASDLVGRIGGEEFAALFPHTALADAEAACERLREAMRTEPVQLPDGAVLTVTVSIGLVALRPGQDLADAIAAADAALYRAKATGRDRLALAA